jgi:hypothetical protein
MKIYLDINGTILHYNQVSTDNGKNYKRGPAGHLKEFLKNALDKHEVYWLSTRCNGDSKDTINYLEYYFEDEELMGLVAMVKPTKWHHYKLEAVDLDDEFMWFDDNISAHEIKLLEKMGKSDSFVKVDLYEDPDIFGKYLDI